MRRISYFSGPSIGLAALLLSACASSPNIAQTLAHLPEVTSFDATVADGKIHVLLATKPDHAQRRIVLEYLVSADGGEHWSTPSVAGTDARPVTVRGNDVQIAAAKDKLVAIWQSQGEWPNMGPMVSRYSHDGGKTWHDGNNPAADPDGDQSHLDVSADQHGYFHAVWLADPEENGYQSLRYARSVDGGVNWQASQKLDDSTCSCCWNTLVVSPTGVLNLLYRDMKPRDMALLQSFDQGQTWQHTSTVGRFDWQFDGCPHIGGGLAITDDSHMYSSVWTGLANKAGLYTLRSVDNGKHWQPPLAMGRLASRNDIAANGQHLAVIWDEREAEASAIFYALSHDGGDHWTAAMRLSDQGMKATHPRILPTANGFLAMWTEKQGKHSSRWVVKSLPKE